MKILSHYAQFAFLVFLSGCKTTGRYEQNVALNKVNQSQPQTSAQSISQPTAQSNAAGTSATAKPELASDGQGVRTTDNRKQIITGQELFKSRECSGCHSTGGEEGIGPGFSGLWGLFRVFEDGTFQNADESYVRESIVEHNKKIVGGFKPANFEKPQLPLKEEELSALVEYIADLGRRQEMKDNRISSLLDLKIDLSNLKNPRPNPTEAAVACKNLNKYFANDNFRSRDCESLEYFISHLLDFTFQRSKTILNRSDEVGRSITWALHHGDEKALRTAVKEQHGVSCEALVNTFDLMALIHDEISILDPSSMPSKNSFRMLQEYSANNERLYQEERYKRAELARMANQSKITQEEDPELKEVTPFVRTIVKFKIKDEQMNKIAELYKAKQRGITEDIQAKSNQIDSAFWSAVQEKDSSKRKNALSKSCESLSSLISLNDELKFEIKKILSKEQYSHATWEELLYPIIALRMKRH
ncbi:MAG: c-type cytochrome [Silvanigrellaceae bacterium]